MSEFSIIWVLFLNWKIMNSVIFICVTQPWWLNICVSTLYHQNYWKCWLESIGAVHVSADVTISLRSTISHIDGSVQDCSISSANAMEILQSCTKPPIYQIHLWSSHCPHRDHEVWGLWSDQAIFHFPMDYHYNEVIMGMMASQITSLTSVYWGVDQRKHQSSASLAFVRGNHRGLVNSPHQWPVTRNMFPFDDVIMEFCVIFQWFPDWSAFYHIHFNTLRPKQTCRQFANDIFKCILLNKNVWISLKISLKFVPEVWINNNSSIGSDSGFAPTRRQASTWANDG